jgi:hypothetical protein
VDNRWGLEVAPYLEYLISELTGVVEGRETRLIINLPPRHLKSVLTSIVFVAWLLGRDPKQRIAVISHSQALASDLASKTLQLISSRILPACFSARLRDNGRKAMDFVTTDGGGRYALRLRPASPAAASTSSSSMIPSRPTTSNRKKSGQTSTRTSTT